MKRKILVIDDDRSMREILNHCLSDSYEVKLEEDAYDALIYMQEGNIPDLIISDLSMPKMSGLDFIQNVRKSNFFNNIPVIVLSAKESSKERIECLRTGADDYVVKPFNPEEIQLRVSNMLRRINTVASN